MSVTDEVRGLVQPLIAELGLELFDIEQAGATLRITVDRAGGIDLDEVAAATRAVSHALDEADPLPGHYTLEVTSPGLERRLRTPAHFEMAVEAEVSVKLRAGVAEQRRVNGVIARADDEAVVVVTDDGEQRIPYSHIDKARTVFEWGPKPKPGSSGSADRRATAR